MRYEDREGGHIVKRDNRPVSPVLADESTAFAWLLRHQGMSTDWAVKHEGYSIEKLPARHCLRCGKDLTDVMGCYVFVGGKCANGLLCVEHGGNGANSFSVEDYERLTSKTEG